MKRVIIGGGMSGCVCAIASAKCGYSVVLLERNARLGKKISVTGNGRCNILNTELHSGSFNDSPIAKSVTEKFPPELCRQFFNSIGLFTHVEETRVYPATDNANSVVDCLRAACEKYGVDVCTSVFVEKITRTNGILTVSTDKGEFSCDQVVLACGSGSRAPTPNAESLVSSKYFTATSPSLVPIKTVESVASLSGTRVRGTVQLISDGTVLATERGEVQFRDFGLSGICIFNLSAVIARDIVAEKRRKYCVKIDFAPDFTEEQLFTQLSRRIADGADRGRLFFGILSNKVAEYIVRRTPNFDAESLAFAVKNATFTVKGLCGYDSSQVTAGGIASQYLSHDMQLPEKGIYAIGEVCDVDGLCGGYNLYFAAASALCTLPDDCIKAALS